MNYNFTLTLFLGNNKDICPQSVCKLKRKGFNWINCNTCEQWYHMTCVGMTAKKAKALPTWECKKCHTQS